MTKAKQRCRQQEFWQEWWGWTPETFTYIVSCEHLSLLKFGKSAMPSLRLSSLQSGSPLKLKMEWAWPEDVEKELHNHFSEQRVFNEWFDVPLDVAIAVAGRLTKIKSRQWLEKTINNTV